MDLIKKQIKDNIQFLINKEKLDEASLLLDEYVKMVSDDLEIYSIRAIISIMKGNLNQAEEILSLGIMIDENNFDINYNLAYVYEVKKDYIKALIRYKKTLKQNYYNIDITIIQTKIDELKEKIKANQGNSFDLNIANIDNILFIDFDVGEKTQTLANRLNSYGINIDLAYSGESLMNQITVNSNPYRKILGITQIDHLIEYAEYYNYDGIYMVNTSNEIKRYFKTKGIKVLSKDIFDNTDEEIIKYFSNNKLNPHTQHKYIENNDITILVPTYNRPYYLNRVLTYINNYKNIKPKVMILDSSKENKKMENKKTISKFENCNIIYNHYSSEINLFEKINNGLTGVDTDYICLCADDDFITEESIIESIKKLNNEKDLYSVKGKNLYFTYSMANLIEYDWFEGLNQNNPIERLKEITKGFVPSLIYQVFRTDKFKNMYLFIEENMKELPENDTFTEYLFYFMVIVTGKIGKINIDLNIRDKSVPREIEIKNFPHAIVDGSFNENYEAFCNFIKKYFIYLGENVEYIDRQIPKIFSDFLVNFLNVPRENVHIINNKFVIKQLEKGMRKSWCWSVNL
ncbi:TIGR00180 family glycosyltransferase [Clostridium estertheticum]|uniref:TIGR00180 family glycosyltransferase n=1 Tax=Clostridium estertheticum TaxID=238834 RepID=UPI00124C7E8D|nr:TIGR00180 family glycosyltransferase [Clostridium estertheticum]MBU3170211.1 TIGR00180 family glycosyltransferase [Clostridium estertheticum]MBZ9617009.1 TIGR00180 family glycosyltransferase [Clostridium estertheticum subsp. laramiense]WAG72710.1 TIGR00180 family glycosyltransferase [Clostridium estertheticum]